MKRTLLVITLLLTCLIPGSAKADTGITDIYLYGPGGLGGTTTIAAAVTTTSAIIGTNVSAQNLWIAQSFSVSTGIPSQFVLTFNANTGTPTGTVTYDIMTNKVSIPGTSLVTGTFTPTASAVNTITISTSVILTANTIYWLQLKSTSTQATGNGWNLKINTADVYSSGEYSQTTNAGTSWATFALDDFIITFTTSSSAAPSDQINDHLAQSFTVSQLTVVSAVSLNLKKVGAPTGTMTLALESDAGNMPSGAVAITGANVTVAESSLTTSYAQIAFTFASPITLRPGVLYWLDLTTTRTDSTVYVAWGATGQCTGTYFRNHVSGVWQLEQYIGTFALTIDSISAPASEDFVTLDSGTVGTVNYSITAGEAGLFGLGIILLIVSLFGVYQLTQMKK